MPFLSDPICVLRAGATIDGRHIEQSVIDDIAETYDQETYVARCNQDHWEWGEKLGSVSSVEKRGNELWATIQPNSRLLSILERGQCLHTSVEFHRDFAGTGKSYLTGLAFTDSPASLGTTQIKLSSKNNSNVEHCSSGTFIKESNIAKDDKFTADDVSFFKKLLSYIKKDGSSAQESHLSKKEKEEDNMDELKALLKLQAESITALSASVSDIAKKTESTVQEDTKKTDETSELKAQVESLTADIAEIKSILEKTPLEPEKFRKLAGQDVEEDIYL